MLVTQFVCWRNIFFFSVFLVCEYTVMLFLLYGKHFISETSNCLRGPAPPGRPQRKKCTQSEYFTICKNVFNFNVLALALSQILGGPKIQMYIRGHASPRRPPPSRIIFCDQSRYSTISNGIFKFNFLALVDSEITGSLKFTLGALRPLDATSGKKFCMQSKYFTISNRTFNFNFLAVIDSEIIGGSQI